MEARPTVGEVVALLADGDHGLPALPGHLPEPADGGIELIAQGLAFDLAGLAEGDPLPAPPVRHRLGIEAETLPGLAAVTVRPGVHLAAAANLLPVVRVQAAIGARLAALPGVEAVCWQPAATAVAPAAFAAMVATWLESGPFPALGLTALVAEPDGAFRSEGLAFFTGQEIRLEPAAGRPAQHSARLAVRLIDELVTAEPLAGKTGFTGPSGERLVAEPDGESGVMRIFSEG